MKYLLAIFCVGIVLGFIGTSVGGTMTILIVYLCGLVLGVYMFFYGAKRQNVKNPGVVSFVMGAFWPITLPILFVTIWKAMRKKK